MNKNQNGNNVNYTEDIDDNFNDYGIDIDEIEVSESEIDEAIPKKFKNNDFMREAFRDFIKQGKYHEKVKKR